MEEDGGTPENEDGIVHQQPHYDDQECGERKTRSANGRPPESGGGQRARCADPGMNHYHTRTVPLTDANDDPTHEPPRRGEKAPEAEDRAGGHGPANQAVPHIAPKPTDPVASVATNMSGRDGMDGMRKKLTPSQVVKNSSHQTKSQRNSRLRRIGWVEDRNALSKLIMRRKNDRPGGIILHT